MQVNPEQRDGEAMPRLADPAVRGILLLAFLFQLYSWSQLEGYQVADSVEYIERAQGFLYGHEILGPSSVRSFAFSALFLPFYLAADWLGLEDTRFLVYVFRVGTSLLGLALCLSCMRLGTQLAGRRAGLWTGLLVGVNPVFLQYSISPVSGIAAALCVSLGLERCLTRGSLGHHLRGGLWLGAGFMMAYQTLPIAASILLVLFARDRWKHLRTTGGTLLGFCGGILGQVCLDRVSYGEWGSSIFRYVLDNAGGILVRILGKYLKMGEAAQWLYSKIEELHARDYKPEVDVETFAFQSIQSTNWYFESLPSAIVVPSLILLAIGLVRSLRKPRWASSLLLFCLAFNLFLLAQKSSKSFRLWLPLFPFLFPLCGMGIEWLRGQANAKGATLRAATVGLLLLSAPVLGVLALGKLNTRKFGVFWEATDWVNARVETLRAAGSLVLPDDIPVSPEGYGAGKVRISGSYHWAMFMRESPLTFLVKLPFEIDGWNGLDDTRKQRNIDKLLTLDWYVTHWPALVNHPDWFAVVNENFTLEAAFYDTESEAGLAAVLVMKRKPRFRETEILDTRTFCSSTEIGDEGEYRMRFGLTNPVDFVQTATGQRARFLGADFETLPGTGLGWIRYHWTSTLGESGPWTIIDRITSPDEANAWQNDHRLANGLARFEEIPAGHVLRESHLVVPGVDAFSHERPFVPLGGPHLRGDLLPCDLWLKVVAYDEEKQVVSQLVAHDPVNGLPLPTSPAPPLEQGWRASPDGLQRTGRFLLHRLEGLTEAFVPAEAP